MKKIINFRPLLILFLTLAFGVFASSAFLLGNNKAVLFLGVLFFSILVTFNDLNIVKKSSVLKKKSVFIFIMLLVFLFGFSNLLFEINRFESFKLNGQEYAVEAVMTDKIDFREYGALIYLKDVTATFDEQTHNLNKNLQLMLYFSEETAAENIKAGSKIVFVAKIFDYDLIKNGEINTYLYNNNIGYYAGTNFEDSVIVAGNATISENIKANVKTMLNSHLSYDNANMAYAVLFGDKTLIDSQIYDSFATSGIAHILAVSGLHISFFVLIILFIFASLKINKKLQFVLLAILLFAYAYLCNFSPSVVRASIMALTILFGHLIGEQNDNLSSLSLAGIIILILNPISLFTAGFLLSFASVFAIFTLFPIFNNALKKLGMPNWLSSAISLTLSAQIGTLPLVIYFFGSFSLLSVITNVLALPLFTLGYLFLFDAVILTSILPFFSFLFVVPNLCFSFVYIIAKLIASVGFSSVKLFSFGLFASLIYFVLIFNLSKFVMLRVKAKSITASVLVVVMITGIVFANLPATFEFNSLAKIYGVDDAVVVTTSDNLVYLVDVGEGDSWDIINIENHFKKNKIKKLEAIVITNYNEEKQNAIATLASAYCAKKLFIPHTSNNVLLYGLLGDLPISTNLQLLQEGEEVVYKNLNLTSYKYLNEGLALRVETSEFAAIIANSKLNTQKTINLSALIDENVNVLVLNQMTFNIYETLSANANFNELDYVLVKTNALDFKPNKLYDTNSFGLLQVKASYDTLNLYY